MQIPRRKAGKTLIASFFNLFNYSKNGS